MQTIGLIGGMSWESTAVYYRMLNEQVRGRLGGFHSAEILMRSVDFDDIVNLQKQGRWDEACEVLANIARALQDGGAGCLLICTNTMHKLADDVQRGVDSAVAYRRRYPERDKDQRMQGPAPAGDALHDGAGFLRAAPARISKSSRAASRAGADSVILGCTEICLLVGPQHIDLPVFDSTLLHADAAVEFSMTKPAPLPPAAQGVPSRNGIDLAR